MNSPRTCCALLACAGAFWSSSAGVEPARAAAEPGRGEAPVARRAGAGVGARPPAFAPPADGIDWRVYAGQHLVLDTDREVVLLDETLQRAEGFSDGHFVVHGLKIDAGATLRIVGSRPVLLDASGDVVIHGGLVLDGFHAHEAGGFASPLLPQPGAAGVAGGGRGGTANGVVGASTPVGGNGQGHLVGGRVRADLGGGGGETGFGLEPGQSVATSDPAYRRGAGGGGGVLGSGLLPVLTARPGGPGSGPPPTNPASPVPPLATGAVGGARPSGGAVGTSPFTDGDPDNDFFGTVIVPATPTRPERRVVGELARPIAGAGGGAGGNSVGSSVFPSSPFPSDEENLGGAGGGGGGSLHVRARGTLRFGPTARLTANGGSGADGELTQYLGNFFTRVGPGGGGGSGGHLVLESRTAIVFEPDPTSIVIRAVGGAGGRRTAGSLENPIGAGGIGGAGIVQLHAPNGAAGIVAPLPLDQLVVPPPRVGPPSF